MEGNTNISELRVSCNILFYRLVKLDSRVPREELLKIHNQSMEIEENSITHQVTNTLDELMKVMFEYSNRKCSESWDIHRSFYYDLYASFEALILPAVGIHHTHFLIFFVTSTKPSLCEDFIERLWSLFHNPATPLNIRKSAADYLASYIGKANFVPIR